MTGLGRSGLLDGVGGIGRIFSELLGMTFYFFEPRIAQITRIFLLGLSAWVDTWGVNQG